MAEKSHHLYCSDYTLLGHKSSLGDYIYYRVDNPASFIKISIEADKPVDIYVLDEENFKLFQNNQLSQVHYYAKPSRENVYSLNIKWHVPKSETYYIISLFIQGAYSQPQK